MANFTAKKLKDIATQALGSNYTLTSKDEIISKAEALIDEAVQKIIKETTENAMTNINNLSNTSPSLPNSLPNSGALNTNEISQNIPQVSNATSQLDSLNSVGGLTQTTPQIPSLPQIPQIPQIPSVGASLPGGISLDPAEYIPSLDGIPFGAFVKPLLDKAISAAIKKMNPSSFIQKAQSGLGQIQQKSLSSLQNLENKAQGALESSATSLENNIKSTMDNFGAQTKQITKESTQAKKKIDIYITVFLQKKFDAVQYQKSITDSYTRTTFQEIDNAV